MDATKDRDDRRVVVIGGGMGGMAAALQLRAKGLQVVELFARRHIAHAAGGFAEESFPVHLATVFGGHDDVVQAVEDRGLPQ